MAKVRACEEYFEEAFEKLNAGVVQIMNKT